MTCKVCKKETAKDINLCPDCLFNYLNSTKTGKKVVSRITVTDYCWNYKGSTASSNGYERLWYWGVRWMAHRFIYELCSNKDIRKLQLDHLCENIKCCNPAHMDPVNNIINCKRKTRRRKFPPSLKTVRDMDT